MSKGPALIIGYGNPLREDDGMGWRAAELLAEQLAPEAGEIVQCHQLTPELAARFANASIVIFLDAACDQPPGSVSCEPVTAEGNDAWSHHLSPGQLLGLSEQLGSEPPPACLVHGGVFRIGLSQSLTSVGEQTARKMADVALKLV